MTASSPQAIPQRGTTEVEVEGRELRLSNLDKVLWPSVGYTKGMMLEYYRQVAPVLLPHLEGRPVTMRRFPDGVDRGLNWYQTECRGRPSWLSVAVVHGPTGYEHRYCLIEDLPSLLWVGNLATVELHPFLADVSAFDRPAALVFDLDPGPPAGLVECCRVALWIRDLLSARALRAFPKTSGSRGLHVYVPLDGGATYDDTKGFARAVARILAGERGDLVVDRMRRSLRRGKVLVDWSQNDAMKSTVCAYSLRGTPEPSVSVPVRWEEVEAALDRGTAADLRFGPRDALARVERGGDLFRPVLELRQPLPAPP